MKRGLAGVRRHRRVRRAPDLPALAALLARLDVLVTGDTGPDASRRRDGHAGRRAVRPVRTRALRAAGDGHARDLRVDLPCSPCGQVRLPPERCRGHVPDCMDGISVDVVVRGRRRAPRRRVARPSAHDVTAIVTCVTAARRASSTRARVAARRRTLRETARVEANRWIKRLRLVPLRTARRCASGSRIAATRCGGSPSSTCTRCGGSTTRVSRRCSRSTPRVAQHAPARLEVDTAIDASRGRRARVRRCAQAMPDRDRAARAARAAHARGTSYLDRPDGAALAARGRAAPCPRQAGASRRSCTPRSGAATARPTGRTGKLHRPACSHALAERLGADGLCLRRRRPATELPRATLVGSADAGSRPRPLVTPIEQLAPAQRARGVAARSGAQRDDAGDGAHGRRRRSAPRPTFRGCDLWPVLRARARGRRRCVQWPWSARAMDEAGAALDALSPRSRRHLCRGRRLGPRAGARSAPPRRPSVGLQHGFIYRHWLNYLHEPDEMAAARRRRAAFRVPTARCCSIATRADTSSTPATFPPSRWSSPAARGSTSWSRGSRRCAPRARRHPARASASTAIGPLARAGGEVQRDPRRAAGARRRGRGAAGDARS